METTSKTRRTADKPAVAAVERALPSNRYGQDEILEACRAVWDDHEYADSWLEHFFEAVGVETRHLALPLDAYPKLDGFDATNDEFVRHATRLGASSLSEALESADIAPDELDALFFTTVTGVASPSIDAKMINRLDLPRNIRRVPMFGLGCVGGAAGLARVADYLRGHPDEAVAIVSAELCSLTLERSSPEIADMIAAALFGDGAATALCVGADHPAADERSPRLLANESVFYRDREWVMGWEIGSDGFELVLSGELPEIVAEELRADVDAFLEDYDMTVDDVGEWVCHPGGPKVMDATGRALGLQDDALEASRESLREVGNLSSASVLCVLEDSLERVRASSSPSIAMAMGPGFSAEFVLLK